MGLTLASTEFKPTNVNLNINTTYLNNGLNNSLNLSGGSGEISPEHQNWKGKPPSFFLMKKLKKNEIKDYDPHNPDHFLLNDA
jgi:hypothetical protein